MWDARFSLVTAALADFGRARAAAGEGRGVILSPHDPYQAFAPGADALPMQDGRAVAQGRPEAVLAGPTLSRGCGVGVLVRRTASGRKVCAPSLQSAASITSDALMTT